MRTRTPWAIGSSAGFEVVGSVPCPPAVNLSSPPGARSFDIVIFCLPALAPPVQGSHASPSGSASLFSWSGFAIAGQLSLASHTSSPSPSGKPVSAGHTALEPVQLSGRSQGATDGRHTVDDGSSWSGGHVSATPLQLSA